jgi:hypothetical protein
MAARLKHESKVACWVPTDGLGEWNPVATIRGSTFLKV